MESKPVVLGLQMAAAEATERARVAAGGQASSPLSGSAYEAERGEFNLTTLVPSQRDSEIADLVEMWRQSEENERERLRSSLTLDDNYTLIQFAKRMAVRSLNESGTSSCERGLNALAMIDEARIDPRDASWAAGLLRHATDRVESAGVFDRAIALATPGMASLLRGVMSSNLQDWGQREWRSPDGIGLIRSGWAHYEPTIDLVAIARRIALEVLSERYILDDVEVATELPAVWFAKARRDHAVGVLTRSLGVVSQHGSLRSAVAAPDGQMFIMWIAELPTWTDSTQLVADVGHGDSSDGRFVVGVATGHLFVLLVGGSCHIGVEPVESLATLQDLGLRLRRCLGESTHGAA